MLVGATGCGKSSTINALFACGEDEVLLSPAKADIIHGGAVHLQLSVLHVRRHWVSLPFFLPFQLTTGGKKLQSVTGPPLPSPRKKRGKVCIISLPMAKT